MAKPQYIFKIKSMFNFKSNKLHIYHQGCAYGGRIMKLTPPINQIDEFFLYHFVNLYIYHTISDLIKKSRNECTDYVNEIKKKKR